MPADSLPRMAPGRSLPQCHEGAVVLFRHEAHQSGVTDIRERRHARPLWKADRMNAYRTAPVGIGLVERTDRVQRSLNGRAGKLIAEYEYTDSTLRRPVRADGLFHARYGVGLAEGVPVPCLRPDFRTLLGRVFQPVALRPVKQVGTLIIHDLKAL